MDRRIEIADALAQYGPCTMRVLKQILAGKGVDLHNITQLVSRMVTDGKLSRRRINGIQSKYTYYVGSEPALGVYDGMRLTLGKYKILALADKNLMKSEIADILLREGHQERTIYADMVKLSKLGLLNLWQSYPTLTLAGRRILEENSVTVRVFYGGKQREYGEGIRGNEAGKTEGILAGGFPL